MTSPNLNRRGTETAVSGASLSQNGEWPSARQFFGQIGIVLAIVVVWAALFAGYMAVAGNSLTPPTGVAGSKPGSAQNSVSVATSGPATDGAAGGPEVNVKTGGAPDVAAATSQAPAGGAAVSFARDVQPLLQQRCVQCHGGRRTAGGVALSTYDQVLSNVLPGNSAGTKLVQLIKDGSMPRNAPPLLPNQIDTIASWIDAGAPNN